MEPTEKKAPPTADELLHPVMGRIMMAVEQRNAQALLDALRQTVSALEAEKKKGRRPGVKKRGQR